MPSSSNQTGFKGVTTVGSRFNACARLEGIRNKLERGPTQRSRRRLARSLGRVGNGCGRPKYPGRWCVDARGQSAEGQLKPYARPTRLTTAACARCGTEDQPPLYLQEHCHITRVGAFLKSSTLTAAVHSSCARPGLPGYKQPLKPAECLELFSRLGFYRCGG